MTITDNVAVALTGRAIDNILTGSASEVVSSGGTDTGLTINDGTTQDVIGGGTSTDAIVGSGGVLIADYTEDYNNNDTITYGSVNNVTLQLGGAVEFNLFDYAFGTTSASYNSASHTLTVTDNNGTASDTRTVTLVGDYTGDQFALGEDLSGGTENVVATLEAPCFCAGTRIMSDCGEVPVEAFVVGDRLLTHDGELETIKWIGYRSIDCTRHPEPERVWPICIQAGAFAARIPHRDLFLSPDHAVFAEGVMIPVKHLVNGTTIKVEQRAAVTYYHVEVNRHDVLLAEGVPCESYLDNGSRSAFANGGGAMQLHPDFGAAERCEAMGEALGFAPLRITGPEVERVRANLRRRATRLGHALTPARPKIASARTTAISVVQDLATLLQPAWYLTANPDVAAAGIDPVAHYARHGRLEGRLPCPEVDLVQGLGLIDPATVIRTMPDVVAAGIDPAVHFCAHGWREGRRPNAYFDTAWYCSNHAVPYGMSPLVHYVLVGEAAGLVPSLHFDPAWYRRYYGLGATVCALAHYLAHRRTQHFSPLPGFDVDVYCQEHAASLLSNRDPYAHFLTIGRSVPKGCEQAAA